MVFSRDDILFLNLARVLFKAACSFGSSEDWHFFCWLPCFGGYFKKKTGLPAGKFNVGQKIFFWLISTLGLVLSGTGAAMFFLGKSGTANLSLLCTVHDFAAVCFLFLLIVHIYLGLVINLETARSIFGGLVRRSWLEEHHPDVR